MSQSLRRWSKLVLVGLGGLILLGIGSAAGVSVIEENDRFCATCHLNPERTYVGRARVVGQALDTAPSEGWPAGRDSARDLASAHRAAALNCVACHRGDQGPGDRATALMLGARNTLLYLSGQFDPDHSGVAQPKLVEASCLRCHVDQPGLGGVAEGQENPVMVDVFDNHFHAYLFRAEYRELVSIGCLDCHAAHREIPPLAPYFIDQENVALPACVQCHRDVEKGPLDL